MLRIVNNLSTESIDVGLEDSFSTVKITRNIKLAREDLRALDEIISLATEANEKLTSMVSSTSNKDDKLMAAKVAANALKHISGMARVSYENYGIVDDSFYYNLDSTISVVHEGLVDIVKQADKVKYNLLNAKEDLIDRLGREGFNQDVNLTFEALWEDAVLSQEGFIDKLKELWTKFVNWIKSIWEKIFGGKKEKVEKKIKESEELKKEAKEITGKDIPDKLKIGVSPSNDNDTNSNTDSKNNKDGIDTPIGKVTKLTMDGKEIPLEQVSKIDFYDYMTSTSIPKAKFNKLAEMLAKIDTFISTKVGDMHNVGDTVSKNKLKGKYENKYNASDLLVQVHTSEMFILDDCLEPLIEELKNPRIVKDKVSEHHDNLYSRTGVQTKYAQIENVEIEGNIPDKLVIDLDIEEVKKYLDKIGKNKQRLDLYIKDAEKAFNSIESDITFKDTKAHIQGVIKAAQEVLKLIDYVLGMLDLVIDIHNDRLKDWNTNNGKLKFDNLNTISAANEELDLSSEGITKKENSRGTLSKADSHFVQQIKDLKGGSFADTIELFRSKKLDIDKVKELLEDVKADKYTPKKTLTSDDEKAIANIFASGGLFNYTLGGDMSSFIKFMRQLEKVMKPGSGYIQQLDRLGAKDFNEVVKVSDIDGIQNNDIVMILSRIDQDLFEIKPSDKMFITGTVSKYFDRNCSFTSILNKDGKVAIETDVIDGYPDTKVAPMTKENMIKFLTEMISILTSLQDGASKVLTGGLYNLLESKYSVIKALAPFSKYMNALHITFTQFYRDLRAMPNDLVKLIKAFSYKG